MTTASTGWAPTAHPTSPHIPNVAQLVGTWNIHLTQNGKPITVTGNLSWLAMKPKSGLSTTAKLFLASDSLIFLIASPASAYGCAANGAPTLLPPHPVTRPTNNPTHPFEQPEIEQADIWPD